MPVGKQKKRVSHEKFNAFFTAFCCCIKAENCRKTQNTGQPENSLEFVQTFLQNGKNCDNVLPICIFMGKTSLWKIIVWLGRENMGYLYSSRNLFAQTNLWEFMSISALNWNWFCGFYGHRGLLCL